MWGSRRAGRVGATAGSILLALAMTAGCGGSSRVAGAVTVHKQSVQPSHLSGNWATTTTTTTPPSTTTTAPPPPSTPTAPAPADVAVDNSPASQSDMNASSGLTVSPPWPHPWPTSFEVGDAVPAKVPLFSAPGVRVPDGRALSNPTWEGVQLVFLVRQNQGDWLQVQMQSRPNGATAWIRSSDVRLRTVENHIVVERGAKRISVYHGESQLLSEPVAVGTDESPTPTGSFFVDYIGKPQTNDGPYGAYQISVTGYSEVYSEFGGGVGQIALHGTNQPELIGTPASHGCVRMTNPTVERVVSMAPVGTPVDIYP